MSLSICYLVCSFLGKFIFDEVFLVFIESLLVVYLKLMLELLRMESSRIKQLQFHKRLMRRNKLARQWEKEQLFPQPWQMLGTLWKELRRSLFWILSDLHLNPRMWKSKSLRWIVSMYVLVVIAYLILRSFGLISHLCYYPFYLIGWKLTYLWNLSTN